MLVLTRTRSTGSVRVKKGTNTIHVKGLCRSQGSKNQQSRNRLPIKSEKTKGKPETEYSFNIGLLNSKEVLCKFMDEKKI